MNEMKRLIACFLLLGIILCGCSEPAEPKDDSSQLPSASTPTTESTPSGDLPSEAPSQPESKKVTVYLLEKIVYFDNGHIDFTYDEAYNIVSWEHTSLDKVKITETLFEDRDANGMAATVRTKWADGSEGNSRKLTYFENGRIKDDIMEGEGYSGYRYSYDTNGRLTEKSEYYDNVLLYTVRFEYEGGKLRAVSYKDAAGNDAYIITVKNGLITEKKSAAADEDYSYRLKYDENGNVKSTTFIYDGEELPSDQYSYKAVEVDANRAEYIMEQQRYLTNII